MPPRRKDNARGKAGKVGKANSNRRKDSTARGRFPESLPEPVAAHHPHFSTTGEAQCQRIFELRAQGFDIRTAGRVTIIDDQGFPHHGVALYELIAEPVQEVVE